MKVLQIAAVLLMGSATVSPEWAEPNVTSVNLFILRCDIADMHSLPNSVKQFFQKGGFVVSLTGQPWESVGIDEAHEMQINRACKSSIVHPSKDYINRVAAYLPYRTKCTKNLMLQLFPEQHRSEQDSHEPSSFFPNAQRWFPSERPEKLCY